MENQSASRQEMFNAGTIKPKFKIVAVEVRTSEQKKNSPKKHVTKIRHQFFKNINSANAYRELILKKYKEEHPNSVLLYDNRLKGDKNASIIMGDSVCENAITEKIARTSFVIKPLYVFELNENDTAFPKMLCDVITSEV